MNQTNIENYERWNLGGKHKWITKAIAAKLPMIGGSNPDPSKAEVVLKLFNPTGIGTWYITEANLETGEAFGFCDLGEPELGYVSLRELRAFRGRFGLPIERDEHFTATLSEVMGERS